MGIEQDTKLRKYEISIVWSNGRTTVGTIISAGGVGLAVARYTLQSLTREEFKLISPKRVEWTVIS